MTEASTSSLSTRDLTQASRADLLHALAAAGPAAMASVATTLGFKRIEASAPTIGTPTIGTPTTGTPIIGTPTTGTPIIGTPTTGTPIIGTPTTGTPTTGTPTTGTPTTGTPTTGTPTIGAPTTESRGHEGEATEDAALLPVLLWRLDQVRPVSETTPPPPESKRALTRADLVPLAGEGMNRPPIAPQAHLRAALERLLRTKRSSHRVDTRALVERAGRGDLIRGRPYLERIGWGERLVVLVDRSRRLIPFWADQDEAIALIERRLGAGNLRLVVNEPGDTLRWRGGHRDAPNNPPVRAGDTVLALSDLGAYGAPRTGDAWARLGRWLVRQGCAIAALVPCPSHRWRWTVAKAWRAVDWSAANRAPRQGQSGHERQVRQCDRLLTRVAPAARIEPGLLRAIRLADDHPHSGDLATEADVWAHPAMARFGSVAGQLDPESLRQRRRQFRDLEAEAKRQVVRLLRRWRGGQPREVWWQEVLALTDDDDLATLLTEDRAEAEAFVQHLIPTARDSQDPKLAEAVRGWTQQVGWTLPWEAFEPTSGLRESLRQAFAATRPEGTPALVLPGMGPEPGPKGQREERPWYLVQRRDHLALGAVRTPGTTPLGTFYAGRQAIKIGSGFRPEEALDPGTTIPLPDADTLTLRTDRTITILRRFAMPTWASAMGQDRVGLWAELEVEDIIQRLRWIPPGRFFMGSPEDEPGRYSDEGPRHLEILEHGFWLADTPCTQALWQAVTGKNPSRFQGPGRPVERVSFEDVKGFLAKLNRLVPGFDARLPSEVEWEYACRAGTTTATYAGAIEIDSQGRSAELEAIAWYYHNSGGETHAVGEKPANPWGLYDMLGNVHERCGDLWSRNYDAKRQGSGRGIRGGSWTSVALLVRAASRSRVEPSFRLHFQGFRLARGQGALRQGAERKVPRAEPEPRGAERPTE